MRHFPPEHRSYRWIALIAGIVALARIAATIPHFSQTIDEPYHIGAAVTMMQNGRLTLGVQHPPLARILSGVLLKWRGVEVPLYENSTNIGKEDEAYAAGTTALFESGIGYWSVLITARTAMLIFPVVILLYVYLFGKLLTNSLVAMLAVVFVSADAVLLGNGMWVATDAAAATGYLVGIYHGIRWIMHPSWKTAAIAGVAGAVAVGLKFSTLIIPLVLLFIFLARPREGASILLKRWLAQAGVYMLVAFIVLWGIYLFDAGPMGDSTVLSAAPQWDRLPAVVKDTPVPMPSFWLGVARLLAHNQEGHAELFLGEVHRFGRWYFFPLLIAVKTPVVFVVALLATTVMLVIGLARKPRASWAIAGLVVPAIVFLGIAMAGNLNLGIRHILPALPFLYLIVCWQFVRVGMSMLLVPLILIAIVETAVIHPDYLAYFNFASVGPARAERITAGSDLDWGQDVYRLAQYLKSPEAAAREYTLRPLGWRQEPLVAALGLDPSRLKAPPAGLYCVSKRVRLMEEDHSWLDPRTHIKRIGYSIDVYDLSLKPGEAEP